MFGVVVIAIVFLLSMAIFGVYANEAKSPIVNPHGSYWVTFVYSLAYSIMFTASLQFGSLIVGAFVSLASEKLYVPRENRLDGELFSSDAIYYFFTSALIFFVSARMSISAFARKNRYLERSIVCVIAVLAINLSHGIKQPMASEAVNLIVGQATDFVGSLLFAFQAVAIIMNKGIGGVFSAAYEWLQSVGGNLFRLSPIVSKLLAIGAIVNGVLAYFMPQSPERTIKHRPLMPDEEANFNEVVGWGKMMVRCVVAWIGCYIFDVYVVHFIWGEEQFWVSKGILPLVSIAATIFFLVAYYNLTVTLLDDVGQPR